MPKSPSLADKDAADYPTGTNRPFWWYFFHPVSQQKTDEMLRQSQQLRRQVEAESKACQAVLEAARKALSNKNIPPASPLEKPLVWYFFHRMSEDEKQQLIQDSQALRAEMHSALTESRVALERANQSLSQ